MYDIRKYLDGCFSILLTGETGSGKTYLLEKQVFRPIEAVQNPWGDEVVKTGYTVDVNNRGIIECNKEYEDFKLSLKEELEKANEGVFICENIENLSYQNQITLYDCLTTKSGGYFDCFDPEKVRSQIICTSNKRLTDLYNKEYFKPLIDRIAQQVIEIHPVRRPSIDHKKNMLREVWKKMEFKTNDVICEFPEDELSDEFYKWLDKLDLPGNYRDLQKITIYMWRFTLEKKGLNTMFNYVQGQFYPHIHEVENNFFQYDKKADDIIKDFKYQLANWSERKYEDTKTLLDKLEIAEKTFYNWKNKK